MKIKIISIIVLVFSALLPFHGCFLMNSVAAMDHAFLPPTTHTHHMSSDHICHDTDSKSSPDMSCCISDNLPKLQAPCVFLPEPILGTEKSWDTIRVILTDISINKIQWDYAEWPPTNRQHFANLVGIVKLSN